MNTETESTLHKNDWEQFAEWAGAAQSGDWNCCHGKVVREGATIRVMEDTRLLLRFPATPVDSLQLTIDWVSGELPAIIEMDELAFHIGAATAPASRIHAMCGRQQVLDATGHCPWVEGNASLVCERTPERVSLSADRGTLLQSANPSPEAPCTSLTVILRPGTVVRRLVVGRRGAGRLPSLQGTPVAQPRFSVCIDFYDDLIQSAWNEQMVDALMREYKQMGVSRVYFIDHYGARNSFWQQQHREQRFPGFQQNIDRTFEAIGDFIPAFVTGAHRHGIELIAVHKPFETGMTWALPQNSAGGRAWGKIPTLGGKIVWCDDFTIQHPELRMEHKHGVEAPAADSPAVAELRLTAERGLAPSLKPEQLEIWWSADNTDYRLIEKPQFQQDSENGSSILAVTNPHPQARFFVLKYTGDTGPTFGNRLGDLLRLRDADGSDLQVSYSAYVNSRSADFVADGFSFECLAGGDNAAQSLDDFQWLDSSTPIAVAVGASRYLSGAPSPVHPQVRDWWLHWIDTSIAAGADGVDLRVSNHIHSADWPAYGFEEPLVEAWRARHGTDPRQLHPGGADFRLLQELRGEFYDLFVQAASERLRAAGRTLHTHVEASFQPGNWHDELCTRFNWQGWIKAGLVDGITLKSFVSPHHSIALQALQAARQCKQHIEVNGCPYLSTVLRRDQQSAIENLQFMLRDAVHAGMDGVILYENALVITGNPPTGIRQTHSWATELFRKVLGNG